MRKLLYFSLAVSVASAAYAFEGTDKYKDCMALATSNPDAAIEDGLAWAYEGGNLDAQHCLAVAELELKHYKQAAGRFVHIAENLVRYKPTADNDDRAGFYIDAAKAYQKERMYKESLKTINQALALVPNHIDALQTRANLNIQQGMLWEAIDDLNQLIDIGYTSAALYIERAEVYRHLQVYDLALQDVNTALSIHNDPEAYIERGQIKLAMGNKKSAMDDFLEAATVAPNTEAADKAQMQFQSLLLAPKN